MTHDEIMQAIKQANLLMYGFTDTFTPGENSIPPQLCGVKTTLDFEDSIREIRTKLGVIYENCEKINETLADLANYVQNLTIDHGVESLVIKGE